MAHQTPRPVVLCILDGWGHREETENNAIALGNTPNWDRLIASCPHTLIETSGEDVGLPDGQMGNSEVGHMNLGAGRVMLQDLPRIDAAMRDNTLKDRPALTGLIDTLKATGGACHLMGLMSPGGVHSHQGHIAALARILDDAGVPVRVHAFLDGRDTPPSSAAGYVEKFVQDIAGCKDVRIVTVTGRYYAMDRDKRWDRVQKAYDAIVSGTANSRTDDAVAGIRDSYAAEKTDEFVLPFIVGDYAGIEDGDALLMANFRADRAREILLALLDPAFDGFSRDKTVDFSAAAGMAEYSTHHNTLMTSLFPQESPSDILGEIVARKNLKQLRIAETEKYAHVTFFFNGGEETQYPGEERILVPSPKVATYDLQPEMSAPEVTDRLIEAIGSGKFDMIVANYANGDMVGHTGILDAAIKAVETVDESLGRLERAIKDAGGTMLVTADHGNCELMQDPTSGEPHTAHTVGVVPAVLVNAPQGVAGLEEGRLADIAPTLLALMGLDQPAAMTGRSLLVTGETMRATG